MTVVQHYFKLRGRGICPVGAWILANRRGVLDSFDWVGYYRDTNYGDDRVYQFA